MVQAQRLIALAILVLAAVAAADVPQAHVDEALAAAGANRAELQRVLDHYPDGQRRTAARFLIANMPGHGYIITQLRDAKGTAIDYDPLAYKNFKQALAALDALEAKHGTLEFARDRKIEDVKAIKADYLIRHIDSAFAAWQRSPEEYRAGFDAFLNYILPYRGSQEPVEDWHAGLAPHFTDIWSGSDKAAVVKTVDERLRKLIRFNERYYLHPTDQGFHEMVMRGQGRCEDMTNLRTYAMRAVAIATAADYTPWWAHRDNNHAWNVQLDKDGRGSNKGQAHAAKIYRKTYAIQRDALCFQLPKGREGPNRFLNNPFYIDVTDQYRETTDVTVSLATTDAFAYLCVFNGGVWKAIHWARVADGKATFDRMGRDIVYLPATHDGTKLVPAAAPLIVTKGGAIRTLNGGGTAGTRVLATAVHPSKKHSDTGAVTPTSYLNPGTRYELMCWTPAGWRPLATAVAGIEPLAFLGVATDGLYWLVAEKSRRLERVFTIENGRQRFW